MILRRYEYGPPPAPWTGAGPLQVYASPRLIDRKGNAIPYGGRGNVLQAG